MQSEIDSRGQTGHIQHTATVRIFARARSCCCRKRRVEKWRSKQWTRCTPLPRIDVRDYGARRALCVLACAPFGTPPLLGMADPHASTSLGADPHVLRPQLRRVELARAQVQRTATARRPRCFTCELGRRRRSASGLIALFCVAERQDATEAAHVLDVAPSGPVSRPHSCVQQPVRPSAPVQLMAAVHTSKRMPACSCPVRRLRRR